jgi:signal transduction histidine kinase
MMTFRDFLGNGWVQADMDLLEVAISELIINSIDAMEGRPEQRITVSCEVDAHSLVISVEDTGHGVDSQFAKNLFRYGATLKGKAGSGLGLYTAKLCLISQHASIHLGDPVKGEGAKFIIRYPLHRGEPSPSS